jgi:hypothetical protein
MTALGLPHSEIPGSKVVCTSPRLIAAYHVLHRLLVPRHPPCALSSLAIKPTQEKLGFLASTVLRFSKSLVPGMRPREGESPAYSETARVAQRRTKAVIGSDD